MVHSLRVVPSLAVARTLQPVLLWLISIIVAEFMITIAKQILAVYIIMLCTCDFLQ